MKLPWVMAFMLMTGPARPGAGVEAASRAQQAQPPALTTGQIPESEEVKLPATPQPQSPALPRETGFLEADEVKDLMKKVWLADFRINDLLTTVQPKRWKISDAARHSFLQTLEGLQVSLRSLGDWRKQCEERTTNAYLCFQTLSAMQAVLPRLEGVAQSISRHENPSLGAQFSQAHNQLFDLQQPLGNYLGYLLRNQNQIVQAMESNLASCHNQLGYAMRQYAQPVTPMKNVLPEFKGRRRAQRATADEKTAPASPKPGTTRKP